MPLSDSLHDLYLSWIKEWGVIPPTLPDSCGVQGWVQWHKLTHCVIWRYIISFILVYSPTQSVRITKRLPYMSRVSNRTTPWNFSAKQRIEGLLNLKGFLCCRSSDNYRMTFKYYPGLTSSLFWRSWEWWWRFHHCFNYETEIRWHGSLNIFDLKVLRQDFLSCGFWEKSFRSFVEPVFEHLS